MTIRWLVVPSVTLVGALLRVRGAVVSTTANRRRDVAIPVAHGDDPS